MIVDTSGPEAVKKPFTSAPVRSQEEREAATEKQAAQDAKQATIYAQFAPSGDHIIAGTNKGWLNIIDARTCESLHSTRLTSNIIFLVRLTSSGRVLLTNSSDRIIRTVLLPDLTDPNLDFENLHLEAEHKYQDLVNRLSWNYATFSSSGEYVAASTYMNHDVYVWERTHGSLVKILEGPKEELSALEWHPHKPTVAAAGVETGRIYIWSILTPQRWSALAPDFDEVEENVEYVEREDEFDIQPIEEIHKRRLDQEDEDVDVLTVEPVKGAEWAEPGDFRMPVLLDIENDEGEDEIIAIGAGQFRRKAQGDEFLGEDVGMEGLMTNGPVKSANGSKRRRAE
jgi:COMPASS component SWD1